MTQVRELFLLTQTGERFFAQQGFRVINRQAVPQGIQQSEEFRSLCPSSAVCMAKSLATPVAIYHNPACGTSRDT